MLITFRNYFINTYIQSHTRTHTHTHVYMHIHVCVCVCLVGRVFANGPGNLGSIPGRVIPKTFKMVLATS